MTNAARDFEQLTLIRDDEPRARDVSREHYAMMREQVATNRSFDSMDDREALATLLSIARTTRTAGDPLTVADDLLNRFGSLKGAMEARREQLEAVPGMTDARAEILQLVVPLVRMWSRCAMEERNRIGNSREAESFCLSLLAGERVENFMVICLNTKCKVLGARRISTGSLSEVSAYPRLVMETALNYNAHSVLLSHNHPGGTCAPSAEDIQSTQQIQRLLQGVGIMTLDHIIVAGDRTYSMIQHGDIDYRIKGR